MVSYIWESHDGEIHSGFSKLDQQQIGLFDVHVQLSSQRSVVYYDAVNVNIKDWVAVRGRDTAEIKGEKSAEARIQGRTEM